jgi:hypothetical protein
MEYMTTNPSLPTKVPSRGVILAEDFEKVRVAYCFLIRQLSGLLDFPLPQNPLCGTAWLEKHSMDFTWDDFNKLGITIKTDKREVTLKAAMKSKDIRTVISSIKECKNVHSSNRST